MIDKLIFVLTQKLALFFVASLSIAGGFLTMSSGASASIADAAPSSQLAIIADANTDVAANVAIPSPVSLASPTITSTTAAIDLPQIAPGLLSSATSTIPFCAASSTCGMKNIKKLLRLQISLSSAPQSSPSPKISQSVLQPTTPQQPKSALTVMQAIKPAIVASATAQSLLASSTLSFKELRTGPYEITVNTTEPDGAGGGILSWNVGAQNVDDVSGISTIDNVSNAGAGATANGTGQFASSFVCDPVAGIPSPDAPDQNPIFTPSTNYSCTLSLTPLAGADLQTQSKTFNFTTPAGQLFAAPAAAMDTILMDNTNSGGIVFDNQDASSVIVTGLTFDISYANLDTLNGPLVFRLLNPATNQSFFDYHLENAPNDTALGVTASSSFTIPAMTQKMLQIQILGVQKMLEPDTTPDVQVTLRGVTTNRSDMKVNVALAQISWSCIVPTSAYDPNATSGPFATGQACTN